MNEPRPHRLALWPTGRRPLDRPAAELLRLGRAGDIELFSTGPLGAGLGAAILERIEPDLTTLTAVFGGMRPGPLRVILESTTSGPPAWWAADEPHTVHCRVVTTPQPRPRYTSFLIAVQLAERIAALADQGWSPNTAHGSALARGLAAAIYPRPAGQFATAGVWLDGSRADRLAAAAPRDDEDAVGCAVLFLHYLHAELGHSWRAIVAAGGPSPAVVYRRLTGRLDDPFPEFAARLAAGFPPSPASGLDGDDPFPLRPVAPVLTGAGPASPTAVVTGVVAGAATTPTRPPALADALAHRRWWLCDTPFRHLRVDDVFVPEIYTGLAAEFSQRLAAGELTRSLPGYDASALAVTPDNAGALRLFLSREWHDAVAGVFGVRASGAINVTLHHHAPGSASGRVHNDLNPAWFPDRALGPDETLVHDPAVGNYQTGHSRSGTPMVEHVRAIALLYYLATPPQVRGGGTGLYRSVQSDVGRPDVAVPPRNNTLVAFECTPFSYHSFIRNTGHPRNCVVMWLHRPMAEAVRRWGPESIVRWK